MDSVLIVVLNWNGLADTERCLTSLTQQSYQNYKILLIDNGSHEKNTAERLDEFKSHYKDQIIVIRNDHNSGFAGGVNIGIRYATKEEFDYIALFNNDAVAEPDWLENLVSASKREGSALTTGLLLHEDGKTIDSTGDWYSKWGLPFPRSRGQLRQQVPENGQVFGVSGGASLYTRGLFERIGLFDEVFFAYYEDVDVSFRANLAGFRAFFESSAIAYHKQGATSSTIPGFAVRQTMKNLPLLYTKNVPVNLLMPVGIRFLTAYTLILAKALLSRNFKSAMLGYIQGVWFFWTHALPERFKIQSRKKVSTQQIADLLWPDLPPDQTGLRKLFGKSVE